ncbi:MAG: hypothetical protein M0Z33_04350 [Actinomycetota bacterium]|nr:hypothetical protein [Actinomycetota bacterium]
MATFVLTYRRAPGRQRDPHAPAAWASWFGTIADHVLDMGQPVLDGRAIGNCSAGTELGGYSIVRAPDLDAAVALAALCPALGADGGVEVGLLGEVSLAPPR